MQPLVACVGLSAAVPRIRLNSSVSRLQGLRASLRNAQPRSGRRALVVQANELNKWCVQKRYRVVYRS